MLVPPERTRESAVGLGVRGHGAGARATERTQLSAALDATLMRWRLVDPRWG